jgi:hypothetical protein
VWRIEESRDHLSYQAGWRVFLEWIRRHRYLVTPRAYGGFVLTWVGFKAARGRCWRALPALLSEAVRRGRPSLSEIVAYFVYWLVPPSLASTLALSFARWRGWCRQRRRRGFRSGAGA